MIHALLAKMKMVSMKEALVHSYTGGTTTSSKEMSKYQAKELISYLVKLTGDGEKMDRMKKKMIAMAHEMGWQKPVPKMSAGAQEPAKVDMDRLNGWCVEFGMYHKGLDKHNAQELPKLVTQFEAVYKSYLNGL